MTVSTPNFRHDWLCRDIGYNMYERERDIGSCASSTTKLFCLHYSYTQHSPCTIQHTFLSCHNGGKKNKAVISWLPFDIACNLVTNCNQPMTSYFGQGERLCAAALHFLCRHLLIFCNNCHTA